MNYTIMKGVILSFCLIFVTSCTAMSKPSMKNYPNRSNKKSPWVLCNKKMQENYPEKLKDGYLGKLCLEYCTKYNRTECKADKYWTLEVKDINKTDDHAFFEHGSFMCVPQEYVF